MTDTPSMRIVLIGARGRLGSSLADGLRSAGHFVTCLSHAELDITEPDRVASVMRALEPEAIVNCCAYNAVDAAEANPALAFAVNAAGPAALADAAAEVGACLVHYSSDFVFDGNANEAYREDAPTNPLSVYGASKLAGEQAVRRLPQHYILRVESLFGGFDVAQRATVDYIAATLMSGLPVRAIRDRTVTPSYVTDVVRATRAILERHIPFGTYHCVASGSTNWHELAAEIARQLNVEAPIIPMKAAEFQTVAPRPRYCALSNEKLRSVGIRMPDWQDALSRHLIARYSQAGGLQLRAKIA